MTFMLIPHNAARPLRWNISRKLLSGAAAVIARRYTALAHAKGVAAALCGVRHVSALAQSGWRLAHPRPRLVWRRYRWGHPASGRWPAAGR